MDRYLAAGYELIPTHKESKTGVETEFYLPTRAITGVSVFSARLAARHRHLHTENAGKNDQSTAQITKLSIYKF